MYLSYLFYNYKLKIKKNDHNNNNSNNSTAYLTQMLKRMKTEKHQMICFRSGTLTSFIFFPLRIEKSVSLFS